MTVSQNSNKAHTPIDFASIQSLTENEAKAVDQLILEELTSDVVLINQIGHYIINSGGKRLRPMLLLLTAKALNYQQDNHLVLAAVIEFIHTATLLHDDVVDESDLRRGKDTANAVWGNAASVLVGDYLYSSAFEMMVRTNNMRVMEILSKTTTAIAEGEVLQLLNCNNPATTEAKYLEVISRKTAILFSAATRLGAVLADASPEIEQNLADYGQHLGIAFQLIDDALDYSAEEQSLGKAVGDDFREGKMTLPILLAYRKSDADEKKFWKRVIEDEQQEGDLEQALELIDKYQTLDDTFAYARRYGASAKAALDIFDDGEAKSALINAVDFAIERAY